MVWVLCSWRVDAMLSALCDFCWRKVLTEQEKGRDSLHACIVWQEKHRETAKRVASRKIMKQKSIKINKNHFIVWFLLCFPAALASWNFVAPQYSALRSRGDLWAPWREAISGCSQRWSARPGRPTGRPTGRPGRPGRRWRNECLKCQRALQGSQSQWSQWYQWFRWAMVWVCSGPNLFWRRSRAGCTRSNASAWRSSWMSSKMAFRCFQLIQTLETFRNYEALPPCCAMNKSIHIPLRS